MPSQHFCKNTGPAGKASMSRLLKSLAVWWSVCACVHAHTCVCLLVLAFLEQHFYEELSLDTNWCTRLVLVLDLTELVLQLCTSACFWIADACLMSVELALESWYILICRKKSLQGILKRNYEVIGSLFHLFSVIGNLIFLIQIYFIFNLIIFVCCNYFECCKVEKQHKIF